MHRCSVSTGSLTAASATGCTPHTGFSPNPSTVTEPPNRAEEEIHREETLADSDRKTSEPSQRKISASQVDFVNVSVRSKSRGRKAESRLNTEPQSNPLPTQEAPVRDQRPSDRSLTSPDSDTSVQVPGLSFSGKKVETVEQFSVCASASDFVQFGSFTPDGSDLTVYNEIAKIPKSLNFPYAKMSSHREPIPGSEGEQEYGISSRGLFSELRRRHQDSGFDSPFYQK